jgi:hypothetical protein
MFFHKNIIDNALRNFFNLPYKAFLDKFLIFLIFPSELAMALVIISGFLFKS